MNLQPFVSYRNGLTSCFPVVFPNLVEFCPTHEQSSTQPRTKGASSAAIQSSFALGSLLITGTLLHKSSLPQLSSLTLQLSEIRGLFGSSSLCLDWKLPSCSKMGGEDARLIYFSSLRDQSPELPVVQYLQTVI